MSNKQFGFSSINLVIDFDLVNNHKKTDKHKQNQANSKRNNHVSHVGKQVGKITSSRTQIYSSF